MGGLDWTKILTNLWQVGLAGAAWYTTSNPKYASLAPLLVALAGASQSTDLTLKK